MSKPTYLTSTSILAASGLRSSVQTSSEAGPRDSQVAHQPRQGETGVDDVLHDQHVAVRDVGVQVLEDAHDARRLGPGAVRGDGHPVHRDRRVQGSGEVGHDHHRALQDPDEQELPALVVRVDLSGEIPDLGLELLLRNEHLLEVRSHVRFVHRRAFHRIVRPDGRALTCPSEGRPSLNGRNHRDSDGPKSSFSYLRQARTRPGRSTCDCPRQAVTSASTRVDVHRRERARRAARRRRPRGAAPGCAPRGAARRARARPGRVRRRRTSSASPGRRAAHASRASASSRSIRAVRARAAVTPGPRPFSSAGSTSARTRDPRVRGVAVVRVVPGRAGPREAGAAGEVAVESEQRAAVDARHARGIPARERAPEPRARPSSTVSAWSSRVWPSSTAAAPCRAAASSRAA